MRLYNIFPTMRDRPESKNLGFGLAYWFIYLIGMPAYFNSLDLASPGFVNFVYLVIHLFAMVLIYREYLSDSWIEFRFHIKATFKYIMIGLGIFTGISLILLLLGMPVLFPLDTSGNNSGFCSIPVGDLIPKCNKILTLMNSPLVFWPLFVGAMPFITNLLYQATVFGPICTERPGLAYPVLAVVVAIPFLMKSISMLPIGVAMMEYLAVLPFYLCAAWIYEKTNTIWAPILFQAIINVIGLPLAFYATALLLI